ncbi:MAG: 16S rRNA (cytosine(1402)-N(4))-methyltransferase RsmH [Candidatus Omnitrophica bacterium]|nr:16S rRNA (cytosine(1402)-N(4))-methyltransferase RsmH [Candidatus Omnitrophota bacterium]
MLDEVMEFLSPSPGDVILDGTCGGGGHSGEIFKRIMPGGKLIAVDADPEAVDRVRSSLGSCGNSVVFVNRNFRDIKGILEEAGEQRLDGALFDLGMSSYQVDDPSRGFSFLREGPLDMRFDAERGISAEEAVNTFSRWKLEEIIREYGEERHAGLAAKSIVEARRKERISSTAELSEVIEKALGRKYARQKLHPAARTFQALRIYVNDELDAVEEGLSGATDRLRPGGRICVISFHSLEDRIAKNIFRNAARDGKVELLTKKPVVPGRKEVRENPRSRSSKLRAAKRL